MLILALGRKALRGDVGARGISACDLRPHLTRTFIESLLVAGVFQQFQGADGVDLRQTSPGHPREDIPLIELITLVPEHQHGLQRGGV
ncbi:MAG: hypothetical protein IAE77_30545 [Prosthecobacter sp.]|nr:hypothetical protein [Prosthecobacter sp.]